MCGPIILAPALLPIKSMISREVVYVGPLTPGPTPGSRPRRQKRVEGLSEGTPFLGDEDVHHEDFRCGGPNLTRLPADFIFLKNSDPLSVVWKEKLEKPVRAILDRHRIDIQTLEILRRGAVEKYETALVIARKRGDEPSDTWPKASKEILTHFRLNGFGQLNIEIVDERALSRRISHPVSPLDPFIQAWAKIRPILLRILTIKKWTLLCVLRRSSASHKSGPLTIIITAAEVSNDDWSSVADDIVQVLDSRGHTDIAIEIYRGDIWHKSNQVLGTRDWDVRANTGGSLGPRDSTASVSTFGGFLELQNPISGDWKKFGITCYHCVTAGIEGRIHDAWTKRGIPPGSTTNIRLDHPALSSHQSAIEYYKDECDKLRDSIKGSHQRTLDGDPSISRGVRISYETKQKSIRSTEDTIRKAEAFDRDRRYLGELFAASGLRVADYKKRLLDWALIDVVESRVGENEFPPASDVKSNFRKFYACESAPILREVVTIDVDGKEGEEINYLFKKGNQTGFTGGRVNGIKDCDVRWWFSNAQGQQEYVEGTALQVLGWDSNTVFGDPGDSGSFAIDCFCRFVGLYLGGDRNLGTELVIEQKHLIADIKRITGCRDVRL